MRPARFVLAVALSLAAMTGVAEASWYDDYDAGLAAVRAGNWNVVVQKMTAAINAKPKEGNKERSYGNIFINYHPYYYRGAANLQLGKYEQAISDLETATGVGPENLGTIEMLMQMAKTNLRAAQPTPVPPTPDPRPPVPEPVRPTMDPALRTRTENAIAEAQQKIRAAQQRRATGDAMNSAMQNLAGARARLADAKNNDDLRAAAALAGNASMFADAAMPPAPEPTPDPRPTPNPIPPGPVPPGPSPVFGEVERRVQAALENYFKGDFDLAARDLDKLTEELPTNGWIWAFLGAAQYSQYAFEADEQYREAAIAAFKKAKKHGKFKNGLPSKYFSRRIRKVYDQTAG